jgi:hypothetical protein
MITDPLNIFTSHCEVKGRGNLIPFQPSPLGGWVIIFLRLPRSPATEGSLAMTDSIWLFSHCDSASLGEAMKIARLARDILGGRGILADHHVIAIFAISRRSAPWKGRKACTR